MLGERPVIGAGEHNLPTSPVEGGAIVIVGVNPCTYPLPALVTVTAVT